MAIRGQNTVSLINACTAASFPVIRIGAGNDDARTSENKNGNDYRMDCILIDGLILMERFTRRTFKRIDKRAS